MHTHTHSLSPSCVQIAAGTKSVPDNNYPLQNVSKHKKKGSKIALSCFPARLLDSIETPQFRIDARFFQQMTYVASTYMHRFSLLDHPIPIRSVLKVWNWKFGHKGLVAILRGSPISRHCSDCVFQLSLSANFNLA